MADDKPMKSSYELAMERLRKSDADAGIEIELRTGQRLRVRRGCDRQLLSEVVAVLG